MAGNSSNSAPFLYPHTKHAWNLPEKVPNSDNFSGGRIRRTLLSCHRFPTSTCTNIIMSRMTSSVLLFMFRFQPKMRRKRKIARPRILVNWIAFAGSSVLSCCTCRYAHGCQVLFVHAGTRGDLDVFEKVLQRIYLAVSHRRYLIFKVLEFSIGFQSSILYFVLIHVFPRLRVWVISPSDLSQTKAESKISRR